MMRLKQQQIDAIKSAAREAFGEDAIVRLFGSRVDDGKRGGDIDLHVELPGEGATRSDIRFKSLLCDLLDEEPIDVVVHTRGQNERWIDRVAYRDGIVL